MLKVVPVLLYHEGLSLSTFALLDDGSEWSMLLPAAANSLGIKGAPEDLPLRTVRQDIQVIHGHKISFHVSPAANPKVSYKIDGTFTASRLSLVQHTYPIEQLQKKYKHLRGLPIPALKDAKPSLLLGSDQSHNTCGTSQTRTAWSPCRSPHPVGMDPPRSCPFHGAAS